jgi:excisionase family DNA binding protein
MADVADNAGFENIVSVKEAAEMLGISTKEVQRYINNGRLSGKKLEREYIVSKESVLKFQRNKPGRPRRKVPEWNRYRDSKLLITEIHATVPADRLEQFREKIEAIRSKQRHTFARSIARYIVEDRANQHNITIWLLWKDTELPGEEQRRRDLDAFKAEMRDVLTWEPEDISEKEGLIYT